MKNVSVIIVNFNCGTLLTECVQSVLASTMPVQVFVSDNNSTDGSIQHLMREIDDDRLKIIRNEKNLGFAKASNLALSSTDGEFLLFLNPDCTIYPDTIEKLYCTIIERPDVGVAGCLIRNSDGSEQSGCRRRVPTPARTLIRILYLDRPFPFLHEKGIAMHQLPIPDSPINVESISGAFMLVKREALEDVGLMDERYFLHCEDLDWCMRFRKKGWNILFVPEVEVIHAKGACGINRPIRVEWHKHCGMVRFYRKFFQHQYPALLMWLVVWAVWVRFSFLAIGYLFRRLVSTNNAEIPFIKNNS